MNSPGKSVREGNPKNTERRGKMKLEVVEEDGIVIWKIKAS